MDVHQPTRAHSTPIKGARVNTTRIGSTRIDNRRPNETRPNDASLSRTHRKRPSTQLSRSHESNHWRELNPCQTPIFASHATLARRPARACCLQSTAWSYRLMRGRTIHQVDPVAAPKIWCRVLGDDARGAIVHAQRDPVHCTAGRTGGSRRATAARCGRAGARGAWTWHRFNRHNYRIRRPGHPGRATWHSGGATWHPGGATRHPGRSLRLR